jgi:hypothetical protein
MYICCTMNTLSRIIFQIMNKILRKRNEEILKIMNFFFEI